MFSSNLAKKCAFFFPSAFSPPPTLSGQTSPRLLHLRMCLHAACCSWPRLPALRLPFVFLPPRCFLFAWCMCSQQGLAAQFQLIDGNIVSAWVLYSLHGHPLCYCYFTMLSAEYCTFFFSPLVSQISQCTVIIFDLWIVWITVVELERVSSVLLPHLTRCRKLPLFLIPEHCFATL